MSDRQTELHAALDEADSVMSHLELLADLTNPERDLHAVSRNALATVLHDLHGRMERALRTIDAARPRGAAA